MVLPQPTRTEASWLQLTGETDNQGNSFAIRKMATTKCPFVCVLIELAVQCRKRRISLHVGWLPREQNVLADELSYGATHNFSPPREVKLDLAKLEFEVLEEMLAHADSMYESIAERKERARSKQAAQRAADSESHTWPAMSFKRSLPLRKAVNNKSQSYVSPTRGSSAESRSPTNEHTIPWRCMMNGRKATPRSTGDHGQVQPPPNRSLAASVV